MTVTVAVQATRSEELAILDSFYEYGEVIGFKPFYDKANDLDRDDPHHQRFLEQVTDANQHHLTAFSHVHRGTARTHQVEAVHSALLVHDLFGITEPDTASDQEALVLLDGNEQKGQPFVRALHSLRSGVKLPATAHCYQAETYYPTSLLADLTATYLATQLHHTATDSADLPVAAPLAKETHAEWGRAYSGMYSSTANYRPLELPTRRGETVRERIRCWYDGAVAADASAPRPATDSIQPIAGRLRQLGYDRLATVFSGL